MQPDQMSDGGQVETKQAVCTLRIGLNSAPGYLSSAPGYIDR